MIAFIPEAQTLFTVVASVESNRPMLHSDTVNVSVNVNIRFIEHSLMQSISTALSTLIPREQNSFQRATKVSADSRLTQFDRQ